MNKVLPIKNLNQLQELIGSKIISVKYQIYKNNKALTQANSLVISEGKMPIYCQSYIYIDVSDNSFAPAN